MLHGADVERFQRMNAYVEHSWIHRQYSHSQGKHPQSFAHVMHWTAAKETFCLDYDIYITVMRSIVIDVLSKLSGAV